MALHTTTTLYIRDGSSGESVAPKREPRFQRNRLTPALLYRFLGRIR